MDQIVQAGPGQRIRRVPEDALDRRAVPEDDAVRPENRHQVRAVLHQRAEPILALAQRGLDLLAGLDVPRDDHAVSVRPQPQGGHADLNIDAAAVLVADRRLMVADDVPLRSGLSSRSARAARSSAMTSENSDGSTSSSSSE